MLELTSVFIGKSARFVSACRKSEGTDPQGREAGEEENPQGPGQEASVVHQEVCKCHTCWWQAENEPCTNVGVDGAAD